MLSLTPLLGSGGGISPTGNNFSFDSLEMCPFDFSLKMFWSTSVPWNSFFVEVNCTGIGEEWNTKTWKRQNRNLSKSPKARVRAKTLDDKHLDLAMAWFRT